MWLRPDQPASLLSSGESTASWVMPICADITVETTVEVYTKHAVDTFGRLDVVFLTTGLSYSSTPLFDTTQELFDRLMKVNVKSGKSPSEGVNDTKLLWKENTLNIAMRVKNAGQNPVDVMNVI
jgi:NAD(P)-dependent dehydrogenase (short-subunit alcohol dehydrogenase family)